MAFNTTYNFDAQTGGNNADWSFISPTATGLQAEGTVRNWSWSQDETPSTSRGPINGQGAGGAVDGYIYTEASSPTANGDVFRLELVDSLNANTQEITMSWYYSARTGAVTSDASIQVEAWNGSSWVQVSDTGNIASLDAVWVLQNSDFTSYTNSDFKVAIIITLGSSGTAWHKDIGLDTINIVGVDRIVEVTPVITDAEDELFDATETNVILTGTDFIATQGTGKLELGNSATYASATKVTQSIDTWGDTSIQFDVNVGAIVETDLWLYVTNDDGNVSNAYAISIVIPTVVPTITNIEDEIFTTTETYVNIDGTDFLATQGIGKVEMSDNATYGSGTLVEQNINTWNDGIISYNITQGSLSFGTNYVFVTNNDGEVSNAWTVTLEAPIVSNGLYKTGSIVGVLNASGFTTTVFLVRDDK